MCVDAVGTQNRNLVKQYIEQQGSLPVRSLKSFLIGPPCVGKTSARRRLMGEIEHISADEIVPSTGINAPLTVRLHHPTEHSSVLLSEGWRSQGLEEQCRALCSYALNSPAPPPVLSSSRSTIPPPPPVSPVAASRITKPVSKLTGLFKQAFSRRSQPTVTTTQDAEKPTHDTATAAQDAAEATLDTATAAQEELTTALTTLVKEDDWMSIRDFLTNVKELAFLNIVDIGGQPEFHEILPLLLHGQALNLIFLNTTQDLDSPYTVVYRDGSGADSPQYTSESTIRQVIQRALCAISSLQTSDEENKSAAVLIGTYCDLTDKSVVLALDQSIQESFKEADFMKKDVLCAVSKPGEKRRYIYRLNNISGDPSEIDKLRHLISTIVYDRFTPVMVPTSALLLHLILRMKFGNTRGWCTLEECIEIAKNCGISKEDLLHENGILQYLHDNFGTVLYYRKVKKLCLRVIVDTNVIMAPPSRLFLMAFGALKTKQQTAEHIRDTGKISHYLMTKVCSHSLDDAASDDDIPTDEIVELLKARYIIFEYPRSYSNDPVYFMPALLYPDHNVAKESSNPDLLASLPFPPVVFLPSSGDVPLGQFPATVVNLSKHWEPDEKNRYRNRIRFYAKCKHDRLLHVELRNLSTHFEFRVLSKPSINTSLMVESIQKLRDVFAELSSLYSHTQNVTWSVGFYCPHSLQSDRQPHTATCISIDNLQEMICSQRDCEGGLIPLNDKHKSWFMVSTVTLVSLQDAKIWFYCGAIIIAAGMVNT